MKFERGEGYLSALRLDRSNALQLLLVAVVLGVGVNLLAGEIASEISSTTALFSAIVTIGLALIFLFARALWPRPRVRQFRGFFIYDAEANALTETDTRYALGSNLKRYLDAAFAENPAMKSTWDSNPLRGVADIADKEQNEVKKTLELVRQAAEYFVLRRFSMRLSDHFRSGEYEESELETLSHTDIPDVLLQNRFMKLFAEPMEERAAFLGSPVSGAGANIVSVGVASGALYERFQLVLPKGWDVKRAAVNQIEISTKRFTLVLKTECAGLGVSLPALYLSDFLNLAYAEDGDRYRPMAIDVSVRIIPRRSWLVTPSRWRYYKWIDDWLVGLEPDVSKDAYLDQIGWQAAETASRLMIGAKRRVPDVEVPPIGSVPTEIPTSSHDFKIGDRVEHEKFGLGQIVGEEIGGVALVHFEGDVEDKVRKLMWDFAPIRVLERPF